VVAGLTGASDFRSLIKFPGASDFTAAIALLPGQPCRSGISGLSRLAGLPSLHRLG